MILLFREEHGLKLTDIANISAGHPFRGKIPEVPGTDVKAVQMKNISIGVGVDWNACIETKLVSNKASTLLNDGDILFAARGVNNNAVLIHRLPQGKKAVASPHLFVISVLQKDVLPEYLAWFLNQKPSQRYFQRESEGTLTKSIRRTAIEATPVIVPSLQKQKIIIQLAKALQDEQKILHALISNGETTMNAIANDLYASN